MLVALLAACQHPVVIKDPEILTYFESLPAGDTMQVECEGDTVAGKIIPNALFFTTVPATLLLEIDYVADSSQATVFGRQQFPLNDSITACWFETRQFWFNHHSLLLYNQRQKAFTDRVTLAEWYGGDGGQTLTGSWLCDFDGDGQKDIVRREIQHSLVPGEEEPVERLEESATLLLWRNGHFVETPFPDTAALIRRFPIRSSW